MVERRVLASLTKVRDLPTLPEVINRILVAVEDERSSARDLTALLECDYAISARVLRLANSAFYGLRNRVDTIRQAVVVLGFDAVRHLALATSVFDTFSRRQQFALNPEDFWMHSLGAAKAAQLLSGKYCRIESPEACFTAGLLHDIGKYLLALILKDEYRLIVEEAQASQRLLKDVEIEKLGMTHTEVGGWTTEKWQFPSVIVDVISNLYRVPTYSGPCKTELTVVALADEMSRKADFGYAGDREERPLQRHLLRTLRITEETALAVVDELDRIRIETREFLHLLGQE